MRSAASKALTDISFDVREHEVRAIIGPNGAGKSSLLNVINGVYHPQQGTITFRGEVRRDMNTHEAAAQGIARTFQNIALFKGMIGARQHHDRPQSQDEGDLHRAGDLRSAARGARSSSNRHKVEEVIDFLEIQHIRKTPVGRLPVRLAEARRARARARRRARRCCCSTSRWPGMNVEEKQDMCRFVLDVNEQYGTTIVLIEHDMGVVMDISDRVVVLDYGKKIGDGTPDEVRSNQAVIDAYLGVAH